MILATVHCRQESRWKILEQSKTMYLLPNLCFAGIILTRHGPFREWADFSGFLAVFLAKTKHRYIFLLTHLAYSSYLRPQPVYLGSCDFCLKRTMVKIC
jgi:hypothetical protein